MNKLFGSIISLVVVVSPALTFSANAGVNIRNSKNKITVCSGATGDLKIEHSYNDITYYSSQEHAAEELEIEIDNSENNLIFLPPGCIAKEEVFIKQTNGDILINGGNNTTVNIVQVLYEDGKVTEDQLNQAEIPIPESNSQ
jgi:hypothetical protein